MKQIDLTNWTQETAYIIGLWMAVGEKTKNIYSIFIKKKDKYILKLINDGEILTIPNNKQIFKIDFIIKNNKLLLDIFDIPKDYLPDFIRGYFDGKGEIKKIKNNRLNTSLNNDDIKFLQKMLKILKKEAGILQGSIDLKNHKLVFGNKDSIKLGKYMYKNNPELFLLRKKQKFNL